MSFIGDDGGSYIVVASTIGRENMLKYMGVVILRTKYSVEDSKEKSLFGP